MKEINDFTVSFVKQISDVASTSVDMTKGLANDFVRNYQVTQNGNIRNRTSLNKINKDIKDLKKNLNLNKFNRLSLTFGQIPILIESFNYLTTSNSNDKSLALEEFQYELGMYILNYAATKLNPSVSGLIFLGQQLKDDPSVRYTILRKLEAEYKSKKDYKSEKALEAYQKKYYPSIEPKKFYFNSATR